MNKRHYALLVGIISIFSLNAGSPRSHKNIVMAHGCGTADYANRHAQQQQSHTMAHPIPARTPETTFQKCSRMSKNIGCLVAASALLIYAYSILTPSHSSLTPSQWTVLESQWTVLDEIINAPQ